MHSTVANSTIQPIDAKSVSQIPLLGNAEAGRSLAQLLSFPRPQPAFKLETAVP